MHNRFSWVGSEKNFIDKKDVQSVGRVAVGRLGGNSSAGQYKNEDGMPEQLAKLLEEK